MERARMYFIAILGSALGFALPALAGEVRVIGSTGLNAVMPELVSQFEKTTGHKVILGKPALAADVTKRIEGGEVVDVAVVNPEFAKTLIASGKVKADSVVNVVRLGIGVAVKTGAPKPNVATADALKQAVLNAKSITYTRGGSGVHFESLLSRWGILDQVKAKAKQVSGGEAIPAVAKGDIEVGVDVIPQIVSVSGVDLVGPLPADLQNYVVLTVVLISASREPATAKAFVDFLRSPLAATLMAAKGMEPIR